VSFYTAEDLCSLLGYENVEVVRRKGRKGIIPGRLPGARHRYNQQKVDEWLSTNGETASERNRQHYSEISIAILKLAEILEWYRKNNCFSIDPLTSSTFPCDLPGIELPSLNQQEIANIVAHLKNEIPEVVAFGEYSDACKKWFALGDKKWDKDTPVVEITSELILKLKLMASRGSFSGKCPDCPA